jgi:osmotically-inducible protein OsmY
MPNKKARAMTDQGQVLKAVRAAFEREPRINLHKYSVRMDFSDGVLTLEGEVEHVAAKKLSLELAIAVPGVTGIVDRLHVTPSIHMGDGAILDAVRNALRHAPGLQNCTVQVKQAVVTLEGTAPSAPQKEMAEFDAWYVFGVDKVDNRLEVRP